MYRFSNDILYTGKTQLGRPYLVIMGKNQNELRFSNEIWKFNKKMSDGSRVYFSNFYGQLKIFKKPLNQSFYDFLIEKIDDLKIEKKHPAIENGFSTEPKRLFIGIDKSVVKKYNYFIDYLNDKFNLENQINKEINFLNYLDDLGPLVLGEVGNIKFVIPEIPPIYLAPEKWRKITWYINNYFSGPYPESQKLKSGDYFSWGNLKIPDNYKNNYDEGLTNFLISKYIIIYEAWLKRPKCDSLQTFIDIIINKKGSPWKMLY